MKKIIILIALFLMNIVANGQVSKTANIFKDTAYSVPYLSNVNDLTLQFWVNTTTTSGTQTLLTSMYYDNVHLRRLDTSLSLILNGSTLIATINDSSITTTITLSAWVHIALTKSNDTMRLYVNGSLINYAICGTIYNTTALYYATFIAKNYIGGVGYTNTFTGNIYDLLIDSTLTLIHSDTCNYNKGSHSIVYAAMDNIDSTHIYLCDTAAPYLTNLSLTSPCATTDTTTDTTNSHVAVANVSNEHTINIYPNPTYDNTIHIAVNEVSLVIIYDMLGKEVYNNTINTTTAIHLTHGMYIVSVIINT